MNLTQLIEKTKIFRQELMNGERFPTSTQDKSYFITSGVVYVFQGKCFAWSQRLKSPNEYCPDVIAISINDQCYQAIGGNDQDGADEWLPLQHDE